jgi:hypothetical protein
MRAGGAAAVSLAVQARSSKAATVSSRVSSRPLPSPAPLPKALYFLTSFFNQFGPNSTTWLVAAEVFPTDVRGAAGSLPSPWLGSRAAPPRSPLLTSAPSPLPALFQHPQVRTTFQGVSAAWGKVGAIAADVAFGYVRWPRGAGVGEWRA